MPIHNTILGAIGRTPLIKLNRVVNGTRATVALKGEFSNPLGSVKDRIGAAMIDAADRRYAGEGMDGDVRCPRLPALLIIRTERLLFPGSNSKSRGQRLTTSRIINSDTVDRR
jgi:hypothetical protein